MSRNLNIKLTDSESVLLQSAAEAMGVTPQQRAPATVVDALKRLSSDEQFAGVVQEVLAKNSELYDRLAK